MFPTHRAALAAALLAACEPAPKPSATAEPASARPVATAANAPAVASAPRVASSPAPSAPAAASVGSAAPPASASARPVADSGCAPGARRDEAARYCIALPPGFLEVTLDGDKPEEGTRWELEVERSRVVITVEPRKPGATGASLKKAALARDPVSLQQSGDLPQGYWTIRKSEDSHYYVEGVAVSKFVVSCLYDFGGGKNPPEDAERRVEAGRAICLSLRAF